MSNVSDFLILLYMVQIVEDDLPNDVNVWLTTSEKEESALLQKLYPDYKIWKNRFGKPELRVSSHDQNANHSISFSRSHTRNHYLFGVKLHGEIGVDAELVDRVVHPGLIHRMKHNDEDDSIYTNAIQMWTIKEAILKLLGTGLRTPMSSLYVTHENGNRYLYKLKNHEISVVSVKKHNVWVGIAFTHTKIEYHELEKEIKAGPV